MADIQHYFLNSDKSKRIINRWDIVCLLLICSILFALGWGGQQMATPYQIGETIPLSLDPALLPFYAVRTVLRMMIALVFSLIFTFIVGALAAKNKRAEMVLIPLIDVMQSIPVLTFLSITIVGFIRLFPNSLLGPECASIFAIFTAQAWNMTLGFYQSIRTVPVDLIEAGEMFQLSGWQRFWRIEVPFSLSSLLWNAMMSMSASWFFVVASEAITVSNQDIRLPGIGSYIALAIDHADIQSVGYAIAAMFAVILLFDQLFFRPLLQWSEKFHLDPLPDESQGQSWVVTLAHRTRLLKICGVLFDKLVDSVVNFRFRKSQKHYLEKEISKTKAIWRNRLWNVIGLILLLGSSALLLSYIAKSIPPSEVIRVFGLGLLTALRVFILIALASLIWVPIGVWIGLRAPIALRIQPILQFLASFPAYLLFPLVVMIVARYHVNAEIGTAPLIILGSQWYILFNVIAGTMALPKELYYAAANFGVRGWLWWKRVALPGILPFYVTGAITAAGGAWNTSIVAEWVHWGDTLIVATGLGAYITEATSHGDFHRVALGTTMMCILVLLTNRFVWRPLYQLAERHTATS